MTLAERKKLKKWVVGSFVVILAILIYLRMEIRGVVPPIPIPEPIKKGVENIAIAALIALAVVAAFALAPLFPVWVAIALKVAVVAVVAFVIYRFFLMPSEVKLQDGVISREAPGHGARYTDGYGNWSNKPNNWYGNYNPLDNNLRGGESILNQSAKEQIGQGATFVKGAGMQKLFIKGGNVVASPSAYVRAKARTKKRPSYLAA